MILLVKGTACIIAAFILFILSIIGFCFSWAEWIIIILVIGFVGALIGAILLFRKDKQQDQENE
jgi:hypothetical protein